MASNRLHLAHGEQYCEVSVSKYPQYKKGAFYFEESQNNAPFSPFFSN